MSDAKADQDLVEDQGPEQDSWREVDDHELGEILGEALAEAADIVGAVDELERTEQAPVPRRPRRRPGWRAGGATGLDKTLAFVLLLNVAFMIAVVLVPEPGRVPAPPPAPAPAGGDAGLPAQVPGPGPAETQGKEPKPPLETRVVQLAEIERLVSAGDYARAITLLETALREQPDMPGSVRRALLSRLAHYAGEAGDHEKALRYLRMSNSGFEISLLPADLWAMASDSKKLGDHKNARRYLARFLLQESLMSDEHRQKIPSAYLELADGYRVEAGESERAAGGRTGGGR